MSAAKINHNFGGPPSFSTTMARQRQEAAAETPLAEINAKFMEALDTVSQPIQPLFAPSRQHDKDVVGFVGTAKWGPAHPFIDAPFEQPETPQPQRYCVGFLLERPSERVLLLRKNKPAWQYGLLNGVGGKIEDGELPIDAMHREWREEVIANAVHLKWREFAVMSSERSVIHCFAAETNRLPRDDGYNDRGEQLVTVRLSEIGLHRDCIRNLKWLLPLAFEDPNHQFVTAEFLP